MTSNGWLSYPHGASVIDTQFPVAAIAAIPYPARRLPILGNMFYDADLAALDALLERRVFAEMCDNSSTPPLPWDMTGDNWDAKLPHLFNLYESYSQSFAGLYDFRSELFANNHPWGRLYTFVRRDDYRIDSLPFNAWVTRFLYSDTIHNGGLYEIPNGSKYADIYERIIGWHFGGILDIVRDGGFIPQTHDLYTHGGAHPNDDQFFWAGFFPPGKFAALEQSVLDTVPLAPALIVGSWWSWRNADAGLTNAKIADADPSTGRASLSPCDASFIIADWWNRSPLMAKYLMTGEGLAAKSAFDAAVLRRRSEYTMGRILVGTEAQRHQYFVNTAYGTGDERDVNYCPWNPRRIVAHPRAVANAIIDAMTHTYSTGMTFEPRFQMLNQSASVAYDLKVEAELKNVVISSDTDVSAELTGGFERQTDEHGDPARASISVGSVSGNYTYANEAQFSSAFRYQNGNMSEESMTWPYSVDMGAVVNPQTSPFYHWQNVRTDFGTIRGIIEFDTTGSGELPIANNQIPCRWYYGDDEVWRHFNAKFIDQPFAIPDSERPKFKAKVHVSLSGNTTEAYQVLSAPSEPHWPLDNNESKPFVYPARGEQTEEDRIGGIDANFMMCAYASDKAAPSIPGDQVHWRFRTLKAHVDGGTDCVRMLDGEAEDVVSAAVGSFGNDARTILDMQLPWNIAYIRTWDEWCDTATRKVLDDIAYYGAERWHCTWDFDRDPQAYQGTIYFEFEAHQDELGNRVCSARYFRDANFTDEIYSQQLWRHGTLFVYPTTQPQYPSGAMLMEGSAKADFVGFEDVEWNWVAKLDPDED